MILFTSLLFALPGLALLGGGLWLVLLGGSWHYLLVGIGFVVTAGLVAMRSRAAAAQQAEASGRYSGRTVS